jgi:hypothetical protein
MAKLPDLKRILREDVSEAPDWITQLIYPVNSFNQSVYQSLNKQLTFRENIASSIRTVEFTTPSTYPTDFTTIRISSGIPTTAEGVVMLQLRIKSDNYMNITTSPFINWVDINREINITHISGLAASTTYQLRVLIF